MNTKIVSLSDGLLFNGFPQAIEEGWNQSVPIAIKQYLHEHIASGEPIINNPHYLTALRTGLQTDADASARNQANGIIAIFSGAVLQKREYEKQNSKSPLNILERSYSALKEFGFSDQAIHILSNDIGNFEYLHQYQKAADKYLVASQFSKDLLTNLKSIKNNVEFLRVERKREKYPYKGDEIALMQPETEKLKEYADGIQINQLGMVAAGNEYTRDPDFLRKEEGTNLLIVPINRIEKSLLNNLSVHRAVTEAAKEGNVVILGVSPDKEKEPLWSQRVNERLSPRLLKLGNVSPWQDSQTFVWFDTIKENQVSDYINSGKYNDLQRKNVVSAMKQASLSQSL